MSALLALALAAAATTAPIDCSWDNPGANRYTGTKEAAIDRYVDLPEKVRTKLKYRLQYGNPDEVVAITRDGIQGKYTYGAAIRDMHFGKDKVCGTVSRAKWSPGRTEPGAVYCADGQCVLVPEICGNVSRISRLNGGQAGQPGQPAAPGQAEQPGQPDQTDQIGHRRSVETITAFDWNDHVGTHELGLIDAQGEEDERYRVLLPMSGWGPSSWVPGSDFASTRGPQARVLAGTRRIPIEPTPVTAVPEASTWATMLAGLGMLGLLRYSGYGRRRQR